jgi:hypothetical protein
MQPMQPMHLLIVLPQSGNQMTGSLPSAWSVLTNLQFLYLVRAEPRVKAVAPPLTCLRAACRTITSMNSPACPGEREPAALCTDRVAAASAAATAVMRSSWSALTALTTCSW